MFPNYGKFTSERSSRRRTLNPKTERLNISLNKSYAASQIFDESYNETIDVRSLNHGLPVIVSDALSSTKEFVGSARFSQIHDFIWLVIGRKLFIWKFSTQGKITECRELALPVSDLEHKSSLVCVSGLRKDAGVHCSPGCVAVSPEGMIRYWPKIYMEEVKVEATSILRGEECVQLEEVRDGVLLLATTTCTLLKIDIRSTNTLGVVCTIIGKPSGLWSGIGRRVSSFFTLSSGQTAYNLKCVRMNELGNNSNELFVLTEQELQCKVYSDELEETASHEINIVRMVLDDISRLIWQQEAYTLLNLKIQPVDMVVQDGVSIYILLVVTNADSKTDNATLGSKTVHYVIAQYNTVSEQFEPSVKLQWTDNVRVGETMPSPRLTLPVDASLYPVLNACVWDKHSVRIIEIATGQILSSMSFSAHGDGVLSCSATTAERGQFLIFSKKHKILSIRSKRPTGDASGLSFVSHNNSAVSHTSPVRSTSFRNIPASHEFSSSDAPTENFTDAHEYIRRAFFAYSNGYNERALKLMHSLDVRLMSRRTTGSGDATGADSWNLDEAVLRLSDAVCNEPPSVDPRWNRTSNEDYLVSSSSVIIQNHLEDKRKVHQNIVPFLNDFGFGSRLTKVLKDERHFQTYSLLHLNAERLEFAIAFRSLHNSYGDVINPMLASVIQKRSRDSSAHELTSSDFFFKEVTRIEDVFTTMLENLISKEELQDRQSLDHCVKLSYILMTVLRDVATYRRQSSKQDSSNLPATPAFIANLTTISQVNLVGILERLIKTASQTKIDGGPSRMQLNTHLVDLVEYLLSGLNAQLEHAKEHCSAETFTATLRSEFERIRGILIHALYKLNETEPALQLAEKYQDYELLVRICEESGAKERLQRYMRQFSHQGFQEFVFRWYLREGKRGQLMSAQLGHHQKLAQFLESEDSQYMAWLQHVNANNFEKAADNLKELAFSETKYLSKKKTLLSLAKLANLASGGGDINREGDILQLNSMLDVVQMQEGLSVELLHNLGMDKENQPVFTPDNLIDLSIGEYNPNKGVADFRKALDLVQWLSEDKQVETRLHIWCRALLLDDWSQTQFRDGDPVTIFRDTMFYRVLESAFMEGINVHEYVPSLEALMKADELSDLKDDNNFVFLLKAGYEQLERICS